MRDILDFGFGALDFFTGPAGPDVVRGEITKAQGKIIFPTLNTNKEVSPLNPLSLPEALLDNFVNTGEKATDTLRDANERARKDPCDC